MADLCRRRSWPDPAYEPSCNRDGHYLCKVRVNNREYSTDVLYRTQETALDGAAQKAFMICRDFSKNDGMIPGQRPGQSSPCGGAVQGLPVAIGTGRHSNRSSTGSSYESDCFSLSDAGGNSNCSSRASSRRFDNDVSHKQPQSRRPMLTPLQSHLHANHTPGRLPPGTHQNDASLNYNDYICLCRRGPVRAYGRCAWCLRDCGWTP